MGPRRHLGSTEAITEASGRNLEARWPARWQVRGNKEQHGGKMGKSKAKNEAKGFALIRTSGMRKAVYTPFPMLLITSA